ncbi:TetR family transcriptional regulator [Mycobacterium kubicae]|uniref:TetR family transcriptional regulator n=1 Tax=Mycobacterium kubicae TaxID=120959 RepID=A0AAX1J921_9MYCO|nr:TetR/AcrR family transcriptional regulator [Mycobacterium kubicae]MCV7097536.1 TetR/AcrR family transcriptional regulator [Mycobacterium kubicae]OBF20432.1 TetR family transcriptional regulator [Mycobacterium kubicae]OBK43224.1 TetR family transcriptional regulator [Mycobacterium kubicae]ORV96633.1 TetR family transcriptional regulator [Mycobacterium kubicae]QNI13418.1 TetR/AcrR family transcriptional regulator [Mycobacterium kubicae]
MSPSDPTSTDSADGRADTTRRHILRAAAHQFARHAYHDVGLDDILAEAQLTKGAMYFHFRSKHALAVAIIEQHTADAGVAVKELLARQLSGLETLIDFCYLIALREATHDVARAAMHLLGTVGRTEGLQRTLLDGWVEGLAYVARRAIDEGDIAERCDPEDVGRLIVSMYMGLRQTSELDKPEQFLLDLEKNWVLVLAGILQPDRIDYFQQFIRRRTALAIRTTSTAIPD